jgi:single-strand DNA-binding protein
MISATVVGNLGGDAESKPVGSTTVVEFSVASSVKVKGEETTTWVRCAYWGKPGEAVAPYLRRGQQVAVSGSLKLREYTKRDGASGSSLDLRVSDLKLIGKRDDNTRGGGQSDHDSQKSNGYQAQPPTDRQAGYGDDDEDSIPF